MVFSTIGWGQHTRAELTKGKAKRVASCWLSREAASWTGSYHASRNLGHL